MSSAAGNTALCKMIPDLVWQLSRQMVQEALAYHNGLP